ncbi:MAG: hypothetical protein QG597_854 [Actinomycetota bacterium]|nr:hypothetical protein [Actinomycetota bacterium]
MPVLPGHRMGPTPTPRAVCLDVRLDPGGVVVDAVLGLGGVVLAVVRLGSVVGGGWPVVRVRLMGTRGECERFAAELARACPPGVVGEVSGFYPNRAPSVLGRVYLDVAIPGEPADDALTSRPDAASCGGGRESRRGRRPR